MTVLIASFITAVLSAFFGGFLIAVGKNQNKLSSLRETNKQLSESVEKYISKTSKLEEKLKEFENQKNKEDMVDWKKEIEILNAEIDTKNKEIGELKENTNRLGKRILEVETELRNTQDNLVKAPEDIKDGMDTLLEALQKESDVLRDDLENAYRLLEKQNEEITKLKAMLDGKSLAEIAKLEDMETLKQQIEELKKEREHYKSLVRQNDIPIV